MKYFTNCETLEELRKEYKRLVKEKTTMVFAYASEKDLRNKLDQVIDLCEDLKKEMTQDAIALEVNGEMFFI